MNIPRRLIQGFPGYGIDKNGTPWTRWTRRYRSGPGRRGVEYVPTGPWVRMKTKPGSGGYVTVILRKEGRGHHKLVHRLVLEAFVGPCPEGMECAHENNDRADNRLSNLVWKTKKDNQADRIKHDTHSAGERNGHAVLTNAQADTARRLLKTGKTRTEIGRLLGVSRYVIGRIALGQTYLY